MWTTSEDVTRFRALDDTLRDVLAREAASRGEERVATEDLVLYLEWLELAREATTKVSPFADKCSPFALKTLSYGQLARDFQWLRQNVAEEVDTAPQMIGA
jgi:hypothetical protein